jgi:hypothetical protein
MEYPSFEFGIVHTKFRFPLTTVGSNPDRDFGFFHVRKLSS